MQRFYLKSMQSDPQERESITIISIIGGPELHVMLIGN